MSLTLIYTLKIKVIKYTAATPPVGLAFPETQKWSEKLSIRTYIELNAWKFRLNRIKHGNSELKFNNMDWNKVVLFLHQALIDCYSISFWEMCKLI